MVDEGLVTDSPKLTWIHAKNCMLLLLLYFQTFFLCQEEINILVLEHIALVIITLQYVSNCDFCFFLIVPRYALFKGLTNRDHCCLYAAKIFVAYVAHLASSNTKWLHKD